MSVRNSTLPSSLLPFLSPSLFLPAPLPPSLDNGGTNGGGTVEVEVKESVGDHSQSVIIDSARARVRVCVYVLVRRSVQPPIQQCYSPSKVEATTVLLLYLLLHHHLRRVGGGGGGGGGGGEGRRWRWRR